MMKLIAFIQCHLLNATGEEEQIYFEEIDGLEPVEVIIEKLLSINILRNDIIISTPDDQVNSYFQKYSEKYGVKIHRSGNNNIVKRMRNVMNMEKDGDGMYSVLNHQSMLLSMGGS